MVVVISLSGHSCTTPFFGWPPATAVYPAVPVLTKLQLWTLQYEIAKLLPVEGSFGEPWGCPLIIQVVPVTYCIRHSRSRSAVQFSRRFLLDLRE